MLLCVSIVLFLCYILSPMQREMEMESVVGRLNCVIKRATFTTLCELFRSWAELSARLAMVDADMRMRSAIYLQSWSKPLERWKTLLFELIFGNKGVSL